MSSEQECACGGSCGCNTADEDVIELSRDQYTLRLENYLRDLKAEIQMVEQELASLRETA